MRSRMGQPEFLMSPDELGGASSPGLSTGNTAGGGGGPPPAAVSPPPSSSTVTPQSTSPAAAGGVTSPPPAAGSAAPPVQTPTQESIRDVATRLGATALLAQFPDDQALLHHLLQQSQQYPQIAEAARYGQAVMPHWQEIQNFLKSRQPGQTVQPGQGAAAGQPGDPWHKQFWSPPEYDAAWEKQILRDGAGNLVPAAGAPPDVVQKYLTYKAFREKTVDQMMANPFEFFAPAIKHLARQEAEAIAKQQLGQLTDSQFVEGFISQNKDWLYARDAAGNAIMDPTNRGVPVLSEWGQRFKGYVEQAQKLGIGRLQDQQEFALTAVQRDFLVANPGQAQTTTQTPPAAGAPPAAPPQNPANRIFLNNAGANRTTPVATTPAVPGQPPANQQGLSLNERLRNNLRAAGINEINVHA